MDKVTNKEILERTGLPSMEDLLIRNNIQWTVHLMRMSPDQNRFSTFNSLLVTEREGAYLRFKDTIKRNLKLRDIKIDSWTPILQQREKWRASVN